MLLAQQYAPDLTKLKDYFIQTPLGYMVRGDISGAVDKLGSNAKLRVDAMRDPETGLNAGLDFLTGGAGTIGKTVGKNAFKPFTQSRFLENKPSNPNPLVGTRYEVTDLGLLVPQKTIKAEDLYGSTIVPKQSDITSRGQRIESVSDMPLKNPVITTGGFDYPRDKSLFDKNIIYASNQSASQTDINRLLNAYDENIKRGGTGTIYLAPTTMGKGSEYFSNMSKDVALNFIDNKRISKSLIKELDNEIKNGIGKSKALPDWKGIMSEEGRNQLATESKYRKAFMNRLENQKYQKEMGFNIQDIEGSVLADRLKGVGSDMIGDTLIKVDPKKLKMMEGSHPAYTHDIVGGQYEGTLGTNISIPKLYGDDFFNALQSGKIKGYPKNLSKNTNPMQDTLGVLYMGKSGELGKFIDEPTVERLMFEQKLKGLI